MKHKSLIRLILNVGDQNIRYLGAAVIGFTSKKAVELSRTYYFDRAELFCRDLTFCSLRVIKKSVDEFIESIYNHLGCRFTASFPSTFG